MKNKPIYSTYGIYCLIFIIGLLLIHLITSTHISLVYSGGPKVQAQEMLSTFIIRAVGCMLFGILIKWKNTLSIFKGNLKPNLKLIPGIILAAMALVPPYYSMLVFPITSTPSPDLSHLLHLLLELDLNHFFRALIIGPYQHGEIIFIPIISIAAGVLIIEGLLKDKWQTGCFG